MMTGRTSIEALEARIAPAAVLWQANGTIKYPTALKTTVLQGLEAAAQQVGAEIAVVLEAGNALYVDANGDGKFVARDDGAPLVQAKAGRALLFFADVNGDGRVAPDELTGVRVGNGFNGTIAGDVHGSVVTGLSSTKNDLSSTPARASVAGLTVGGAVEGYLLASGTVAKVSVLGEGVASSVAGILTGNAALGVSYGLGLGAPATFSVAEAGAAATISNLRLAHGTGSILAGNGGSVSAVTILQQHGSLEVAGGDGVLGGNGGSVLDLTIQNAADGVSLLITGGEGSGSGSKAGAGGEIRGIKISGGELGSITLVAGSSAGPEDGAAVAGRDGASVQSVWITAAALESLDVTAGAGGMGGVRYSASYAVVAAGSGGDGGSILDLHLQAASGATLVSLTTGSGGSSGDGERGTGGDGGTLGARKAGQGIELAGVGEVSLTAGAGEAGGSGGAGGSILGVSLVVTTGGSSIETVAGAGSAGTTTGGAGGSIGGLRIAGAELNDVTLTAGSAGGISAEGTASGAAGGAISEVQFTSASIGTLTVQAGDGADGAFRLNAQGEVVAGGAGGMGGSISQLALQTSPSGLFPTHTVVSLAAGNGGAGQFSKNGGAGGNLNSLALVKMAEAKLTAGNGGSAMGTGLGAAGGDVSEITAWESYGEASITAGRGGDGAEGGAGGRGGSIFGTAKAALALAIQNGALTLQAGDGGNGGVRYNAAYDAVVKSGAGGVGGRVEWITVQGAEADFFGVDILAGAGGAGGGFAAGGAGGTLQNLSVSTPFFTEGVRLVAGNGGDADASNGGALAGVGGSIAQITLIGPAWLESIATLQAGAGGAVADDVRAADGVVVGISFS